MTTFKSIAENVKSFNFGKINFPHSSLKCPIFYNTDNETFSAWSDDTNIVIAESQNTVILVGYLTAFEASIGDMPNVYEYEERIKMHFTNELV